MWSYRFSFEVRASGPSFFPFLLRTPSFLTRTGLLVQFVGGTILWWRCRCGRNRYFCTAPTETVGLDLDLSCLRKLRNLTEQQPSIVGNQVGDPEAEMVTVALAWLREKAFVPHYPSTFGSRYRKHLCPHLPIAVIGLGVTETTFESRTPACEMDRLWICEWCT